MLICNVWDVQSAKTAQNLNFQAIGTSSSAIAAMLGYRDGEEMSFQELEYLVGRITKSVDIPLSVDLEGGFSRDPKEIVDNIIRLSDLGVVGINIEDSVVDEKREILNANAFSKTLENICASLKKQNKEVFINVRTDAFLLGLPNPVEETIDRGQKYESAGADGLFVPCIVSEDDIKNVIEKISLPLNVMCMPNLPNFEVLNQLGVSRISMGNFVFGKMAAQHEQQLKNILEANSFNPIFS